jgi:hypothetical protein
MRGAGTARDAERDGLIFGGDKITVPRYLRYLGYLEVLTAVPMLSCILM